MKRDECETHGPLNIVRRSLCAIVPGTCPEQATHTFAETRSRPPERRTPTERRLRRARPDRPANTNK